MARGFLGGLVAGVLVIGGGVAVMSLLSPVAPEPDVAAVSPDAGGDAPAPSAGTEGVARSGGDADLVETPPTAPEHAAQPDDAAALAAEDRQSAAKPEVGEPAEGMAKPQSPDAAADVTIAEETPVSPSGPAQTPDAPAEGDAVSIATDPVQPVTPDVDSAGTGFAAPPVEDSTPEVPRESDTQPLQPAGIASVGQPAEEVDPEAQTDPGAAPSVAASEAADPASAVTEPTEPEIAEAPETAPTDTAPEPASEPRIAALPQTGAGQSDTERPGIGTPVVPLTERDADTQVAPTDAQPQRPPLERYAEPFKNPEQRPLMAIVLIDDAEALGAEALQEFPYPLSFAVDPTLPDAAERMARHRQAGFEVVALFDLPAQASPQDAEVALAAGLDLLPETVAVLEGAGSGVQGNRGLSDQVTAITSDSGRGLITQDNGLNTVHKLAVRAGVPAAVVFRDFDGAGQSPTVMRRFLDQAAFRARQEGAVIMLGRVRPDTVSALLLWGLQDRAARVALAPVSAVLTRERE